MDEEATMTTDYETMKEKEEQDRWERIDKRVLFGIVMIAVIATFIAFEVLK